MNDNDYIRLGAHKFEQDVHKLFEAEKSRTLACGEEFADIRRLAVLRALLRGNYRDVRA